MSDVLDDVEITSASDGVGGSWSDGITNDDNVKPSKIDNNNNNNNTSKQKKEKSAQQTKKPRMTLRSWLLLSGLYTTQFLSLAFVVTAVPAILRQNGASLDEIAWIYLLGLMWAIKFLWAPVVDRYGCCCGMFRGHYRSWLIVMQSLLVVTTVAASLFEDLDDDKRA